MSEDDDYAPFEYSPSEWEEILAPASFDHLPDDQMMLLYRHWLWADFAHREFEKEEKHWKDWMDLPVRIKTDFLDRATWAEYVFFGLLSVLIEGMTWRRVRYGGRLVQDVRQIREPLRAARNATFHVGSEESSFDERLRKVGGTEEPTADTIERVHRALGVLLRAELYRRPIDPVLRRHVLGRNETD